MGGVPHRAVRGRVRWQQEVGPCPAAGTARRLSGKHLNQLRFRKSDPVADLIAQSDQHFETGRKELEAGHLETAKTAFNRSLEVLLEWPGGARSEPRIREQYDRLVERISAYEVTALAQGDGFAEKASEPASIDELLAISTFEPPPAASKETEQTVAQDLQEVVARHRDSAESAGPVLRSAVHRPFEGLSRGRARPRRAASCR